MFWPYGRLSQLGDTMHCPNCCSEKLVAIKMALADEGQVTFRSCRACEHKWWERMDTAERLPLATVLDMARVRHTA
jgi:transcription elongation factor Elf1